MAENGLLAVLALLVAGYSLLPEEKKLDCRVRMSWIDYAIAFALVAALAIIIYSPVLIEAGVEPQPWRWGFDESSVSFTWLLLIILFFATKSLGKRLPRSRLIVLISLLERLVRERHFAAASFLLAKYQVQLFTAIERNPWWVRVQRKLKPIRVLSPHRTQLPLMFIRLRLRLAKFLPSHSSRQKRVESSVSRILRTKSFARHLVHRYPALSARATTLRFAEQREYTQIVFEELLSDTESPLYMELRDNQSCSHTGEWRIDSENVLLSFYFTDVRVAIEADVSKPVGDYVKEFIKKQKGKNNFYNQYSSYVSDGGLLEICPIFAATQFFSIMVSSSIFQGNRNHMWVMYLLDFTQEILKSMDREEQLDGEFPSRFDFLLFYIFGTCKSLAGTARYRTYAFNQYTSHDEYPEGWSAWILGQILRELVLSDKVLPRQKTAYLQSAVRLMGELDEGGRRPFSRWIFTGCVQPRENPQADQRIVSSLREIYRDVDPMLKTRDSTFETRLGAFLQAQ